MNSMADRYSRQILFPGIGRLGQERILNSRVTVVGCGALGTVGAEMLVRGGVGEVVLVDRDFVEPSNLQRQTLFTESDADQGIPKAIAAQKALVAINSEIDVQSRVSDLTFENVDEICSGSNVLVDATDNFEARYLMNDYAFKNGIPWVYGACVGSYGTAFAFQPGRTPCLQCLFRDPPASGSADTCETAGILAPVAHMVASYQVAQVLKILVGEHSNERLFQIDVWEESWREISLAGTADSECRCCGRREFRFLEGRESDRLIRLCGRNAIQVSPGRSTRLDFHQLSERLQPSARAAFNEYMMRIQVVGYDIALFPDGRCIIKGTDDPARARGVYARYIGC
ncbi:MAG: ThiF family adenylyltransferase [Acidobacteriota bacterium]